MSHHFGQWNKTIKVTLAVYVQNLTSVGIYANNNDPNRAKPYIKMRKVGYSDKQHGKPTIGICMKTVFSYHTLHELYGVI